jgi:IclR family transcriptional regulator, pca regulon regulatory protein
VPRCCRAAASVTAQATSPSSTSNRTAPLAGDRGTTFVQSLERGLAVIRTFDRGRVGRPSEVAAATGLTRAAARRFLLTLSDLGYVRAAGNGFQLSPRVLELGRAYLSGLTLPDAALPFLRDLVGHVRESSSVAVLDGERIVYVAHVAARRVLAVSVTVGSDDPAFATSLGRVLLAAQDEDRLERFLATAELTPLTARTIVDPDRLRAELARVRRQGWALVDQELEEGLRAVAAPIHDGSGKVVAAVNVDPQATRWSVEEIRASVVPQLLDAAAAIEGQLAAGGDPSRGAPRQVLPVAEAVVERGGDFVQSLGRGLAVIRTFDGVPSQTLSEVAVASGLTRAAARRFLLTLAELGYVDVEGRSFRLTPRVLELGRAYLSNLTLPEVALPHLRDLVAGVRESSTVAVLDRGQIIYIAHVRADRVLSVLITVGGRDPAESTALGRMLLASQSDEWLDRYLAQVQLVPHTSRTIVDPARLRAELVRVRRQGFALVDQELEEGLRAVAVPVHDGEGRVVAAVNVALHASRWAIEAIRTGLVPSLLETAAAIDADLAATGVVSYDLTRQWVGDDA